LKGGVVFNVREFSVECGGATITIKGSLLGTLETAGGQTSARLIVWLFARASDGTPYHGYDQ
jgi:hypothetical protein